MRFFCSLTLFVLGAYFAWSEHALDVLPVHCVFGVLMVGLALVVNDERGGRR